MRPLLLLNASPRVDGHSLRLARAVADAAVAAGPSRPLDIVHLYTLDIRPCLACGVCDASPHCPIGDAVPDLRRRIDACAGLVIASPLHFVSLTAPLIALYSRLQPYWTARRRGEPLIEPGRRAAALAVSGGSKYRDMFGPARAVTAALLNSMGINFVGMATLADTDTVAFADNPAARDDAEALGRRLAAAIGE